MCGFPLDTPPPTEAEILRNKIKQLTRVIVDVEVDLCSYAHETALTEAKLKILISSGALQYPEVHLHRAISASHHQAHTPNPQNEYHHPGSPRVPEPSPDEPHEKLWSQIIFLANLPQGFPFALDIILRHVWLCLTQSTSFLAIVQIAEPNHARVLHRLQKWDELAWRFAWAWVDLPREGGSSGTSLQQILDVVTMIEAPKLRASYCNLVLPKTSAYLRTVVRRRIVLGIVERVVADRLPVELFDLVVHGLLKLKDIISENVRERELGEPSTALVTVNNWPRMAILDRVYTGLEHNLSARPTQEEARLACPTKEDCCCWHDHIGSVRVCRWDSAQKRYVPAHRTDFARDVLHCDLKAGLPQRSAADYF